MAMYATILNLDLTDTSIYRNQLVNLARPPENWALQFS